MFCTTKLFYFIQKRKQYRADEMFVGQLLRSYTPDISAAYYWAYCFEYIVTFYNSSSAIVMNQNRVESNRSLVVCCILT